MPLGIRALSLGLISLMAKNPRNQLGGSGRLELMRQQYPGVTNKYPKPRSGKGVKKPSGPKPVKIRAEQEDM